MTLRTVIAVVVVLAPVVAFAQNGTQPPPGNPGDWSAPPMTGAPVTKPPPPADAVGIGLQFHGELSGGTAGFGGAASFGIGFNRVAILFTPSLGLASIGGGSSNFTLSGDLSVRIYLHQRSAGVLVAYLRPGVGFVANVSGFTTLLGTLGFGAGGEYLLTKNLGFTVELALRLIGISTTTSTVATIGSVGIMLHQ